jgi:hypothetical protein
MGSVVFAQVKVTFRVNMGAQVYNQKWIPGTDSICVRGSFQTAAGDGTDWGGYTFKLSLIQDTIYGVTATLPSSSIGTTYSYKFVKNNDGWENDPNRTFVAPTKDSVLDAYWYNNDSTHISNTVTNTVNFNIDVAQYLGTGAGYFDPSTDSLLILGIVGGDWSGNVISASGDQKLQSDLFTSGLYHTSMVVKGAAGKSMSWKVKAYPDSKFDNGGGYETGANNTTPFVADGGTIDVTHTPTLMPIQEGIPNSLDILFECNIRVDTGIVNAKNGRKIPVDSVTAIGIKGNVSALGKWNGNWVITDTLSPSPTLLPMYDDGTNGDKVAGDKIFSRLITFPALTPKGKVEYKYAAFYPAAGTDGGASSPLDNEAGNGVNHSFTLTATGPTFIHNDFGNTVTAVRDVASLTTKNYKLYQNYPNPFNPSTKISFSLPTDGNVVLKVYNILGKEVATLVNGFQKAGGKEVSFNASNLPSGMYIYTIKSGNFTSSKKMMLLK